ncbi:MAG: response regulator [SAR324 cluster bacterium]|nr:response regulator [SAR324 cluster bacterium]
MEKQPVLLIIDDEPDLWETIKNALKREAYELVFAQNGKQGLELFHERTPSLILLDLRMPGMNGLEFLQTIKPEPSDPYFVYVLTGHGNNEDVKACYAAGAHGFLRKPFNIHELRGVLKRSIQLIKNRELSSNNKDAYVDFIVNSSNCRTPEQLTETFFEAVKRLYFENWGSLNVSILTRNEGSVFGLSDQTSVVKDGAALERTDLNSVTNLSALEQKILKKTLNEYTVETKEGQAKDAPTVHAAWAIFWELEGDPADSSGLAVLIRNYPSLECSDETQLATRKNIREDIENAVAKMLERVSEVMEKLNTQRKLKETNALLEKQKTELEHERETTKKIVLFSVQEFQVIFEDSNDNQEKQMELWENALASVKESFNKALEATENTVRSRNQQISMWRDSVDQVTRSFTQAMSCFTELQPGQQTFLTNLNKLKSLYSDTDLNEKLTPGQMSHTDVSGQQENVDDLLASLGL